MCSDYIMPAGGDLPFANNIVTFTEKTDVGNPNPWVRRFATQRLLASTGGQKSRVGADPAFDHEP